MCFVSCVCVYSGCTLGGINSVSTVAAQLLAVTLVSAAERQAKYESVDICTSDAPQSLVKKASKIQCAACTSDTPQSLVKKASKIQCAACMSDAPQ